MKFPVRNLLFILLLSILTLACENDIERINMLTNETKTPKVKGRDIEVIYTDSARLKARMQAPIYLQYPDLDEPYMEFPEGMHVYMYNDSSVLDSEIIADYAIYYMNDRLWHATGNVIAQKFDNGDALYTEELFWDEEKELIYSDSYTRVHNDDNTLYGKNGFTSHQSLNDWQLKGSSGTINVKDEE